MVVGDYDQGYITKLQVNRTYIMYLENYEILWKKKKSSSLFTRFRKLLTCCIKLAENIFNIENVVVAAILIFFWWTQGTFLENLVLIKFIVF